MTVVSFRRSRGLVWGVLVAFAVFMTPAGLAAKSGGAAPEPGSLTGFVFAKDGRTPVPAAVVKIRSLAESKELASRPTDEYGMYAIKDIPEGRYILGVTSANEDFNLDYEIYVKGGELGKLSLSLAPDAVRAGDQEEGVQSGEKATKKKGFFNSTAGRIVIIAAAGVGLYFLIAPHNESSPIR
jgi:hypothetical protein